MAERETFVCGCLDSDQIGKTYSSSKSKEELVEEFSRKAQYMGIGNGATQIKYGDDGTPAGQGATFEYYTFDRTKSVALPPSVLRITERNVRAGRVVIEHHQPKFRNCSDSQLSSITRVSVDISENAGQRVVQTRVEQWATSGCCSGCCEGLPYMLLCTPIGPIICPFIILSLPCICTQEKKHPLKKKNRWIEYQTRKIAIAPSPQNMVDNVTHLGVQSHGGHVQLTPQNNNIVDVPLPGVPSQQVFCSKCGSPGELGAFCKKDGNKLVN